MDKLLLENAWLRLTVVPQGAAILSLESLEHQKPILNVSEKAMFLMLPPANRVAGNNFRQLDSFFLHGDGKWSLAMPDRSLLG